MTGRSWCTHTPAPLTLGRDDSKVHVLLWSFPEFSMMH